MDLQQQLKDMDQCLSRRKEQLYRRILTNASKGLTFSQDVMWERGPDSIQYSKTDFSWLFCASGLLAPITRSKSRKHGGTKVLLHHTRLYQTPLPDLPLLRTVRNPSLTINETYFTVTGHQDGRLESIISYQFPTTLKEKEQSRTRNGDESVQKKTTKNTVQQFPGGYRYKARLLQDQYGSINTTDLGTNWTKDREDFCGIHRVPKSITKPRELQSRKPENLLPVYCRIQGYSVSPVCRGAEGGINRRANNVAINHMDLPKLPCLQNTLSPAHAVKYDCNTENFKSDPYTGTAKLVQQPGRKNQDCIIMDNNSEDQINPQDSPCDPERWADFPTTGLLSVTEAEMGRLKKGVRRGVGLPTNADYSTELGLRPPDYNRQHTELAKQPIYLSLHYAVEGWRNAQKIKTSWHSITTEGLKKNLTDLHCQVRVAALATCASAAVNSRLEVGPDGKDQSGQSYEVEAVPPELQSMILIALNDPMTRVQLAAAVCLYAIGTPNADARNTLQKALQHDSLGTRADGWVAAQCLAIEGEASLSVIGRIISQLFLSNVRSDQEQAAALLASISRKTILVQSLLGEQLNSSEWRTRVLACKTISELNYPIKKDLTKKLLYMMWNDWSDLVRQAAAQALGKLGFGSVIHDELSVILCEGPTPLRVEALVRIGQLKIMTAKLLPSFLCCLNDEYVVVRKQACSAAASLMIKDKMIQNKLFQLMQNDSSCDVKVAAINALGRIGWLTPTLQELLLWTLQHEEEPSVRIAACEALKMLGVKAPELQNLLQENYALETNAEVHRHMEDLMKHCGYRLDRDKGMGQMITEQVKKLCTKSKITEKLLQLEDLKQQTMPRKKS